MTIPKDNQATQLVKMMLAKLDLFHDGNIPYAIIQNGNHRETISLRTRSFRESMASQFYHQCKKAPGNSAIESALTSLCGRAIAEGPERKVFQRIGHFDGKIYLDLTDPDWNIVEISPRAWKVIQNPPIPFKRKKGMLALPIPQSGGDLDELRNFLNFGAEENWILIISWLLAAYSDGPYPVLVFGGEQGTGKSTQTRILRELIDPNEADIRTKPRDEHDLMIAAGNSWVLAYDNLSSISDWLSDAFCRLSTGGGWSTRELWTNEDETIINAKRPTILNGITDFVTRGDLMGRSILINLPPIDDYQRKPEAEFWTKFNFFKPLFLGAILNVVALTLEYLPKTKLTSSPRMADFARWITAAESALNWQPGTFLKAYSQNQESATITVLEDSIIASDVIELVASKDWEGTSKELLTNLTNNVATYTLTGYVIKTPKYEHYQKIKPNFLAGELRRLAPVLRTNGIDIVFTGLTRKRGKPEKLICINNLALVKKQVGVNQP